jgi:glutathione S-transferase
MQLVGMLDSPYVRRVAISLLALGLPFLHRAVSVFRGIEEFRLINPVVKAPTFVCDDGTVLMDSTLILEYGEALARPRTLLPSDPAALARSLRLIGLALAACEKSAQLVYERALRPPEKRHGPWVQRVTGQLQAAYAELEALLAARPIDLTDRPPMQDVISVAVAWHFTQRVLADHVPTAAHPALVALSRTAEALPLFRAAPHGEEPMDGGA